MAGCGRRGKVLAGMVRCGAEVGGGSRGGDGTDDAADADGTGSLHLCPAPPLLRLPRPFPPRAPVTRPSFVLVAPGDRLPHDAGRCHGDRCHPWNSPESCGAGAAVDFGCLLVGGRGGQPGCLGYADASGGGGWGCACGGVEPGTGGRAEQETDRDKEAREKFSPPLRQPLAPPPAPPPPPNPEPAGQRWLVPMTTCGQGYS